MNVQKDSIQKYYIAFWPSPEKAHGKSIWDQFQGDFSHLDQIRLFRFLFFENNENVTVDEII